MKKFIGKSLVVALMVLPMLSHAGKDCGSGTVLSTRDNVGGEGHYWIKMQWDEPKPSGLLEWHGGMLLFPQREANQAGGLHIRLRNKIEAAYHAGSHVRFWAAHGANCNDPNEIAICKTKEICHAQGSIN